MTAKPDIFTGDEFPEPHMETRHQMTRENMELERAVKRLSDDLTEPFGHFAGEAPESCALVRIEDARVILSALSAAPLHEGEGERERVSEILAPMVRAVAANSIFTAHEREDYLRSKTDAILVAVAAPASPPVAGVELQNALKPLAEAINRAGTRPNIQMCGFDAVRIICAFNRLSEALASPVGGDGSLQAEDRPSVPSQREVRLVLAARAVAFDDHFSPSAIKELDAASEAYAADVPWEDEPEPPQSIEQIIAPVASVMGQPVYSLDDAVSAIRTASAMLDPPASSRSPGMETLQASQCTKHGEGDQ